MSIKRNGTMVSGFWWLLIAALCTSSAIVAVLWSENDAIREMATSAFGGGIIGSVILFYEQFREERREKLQNERDIEQAERLQKGSDRGADLRSAADILLKELKPTYDKYFTHALHKDRAYCPEFREVHNELMPLLDTCEFYVMRTNDELLNQRWIEFREHVKIRRDIVLEEKRNSSGNTDVLEAPQKAANTALMLLLDCSEALLSKN